MGIGDSDHIDLSVRFTRLLQVLQAAQTIHSTLDVQDIVKEFLTLSVKELETEGGTIYLLDPHKNVLESMHSISPVYVGKIILEPGEGIAGQAASTGEPVIVEGTGENRYFTGRVDQRTGLKTSNTLCFPLRDREGRVMGVLQLVNKKRGAFNPEDLDFLQDLSVFLALAIKNAHYLQDSVVKARMEKEIFLARDIQAKILPRSSPEIAGYDVRAFFASCHETAGDYYQFFRTPGASVAVLIDVSGKGLASAMVAFSIHTFLSLQIPSDPELPDLIGRLNGFLLDNFEGEKYATGVWVKIPDAGPVRLLNAGHTPVIHLSGDTHTLIKPTGMPAGMLPGVPFREVTLDLQPQDLLCIYSDGYTEAPNPAEEEYGVDRLLATVKDARHLDAPAFFEHVNTRLAEFQDGAKDCDDRTMMVLRRQP